MTYTAPNLFPRLFRRFSKKNLIITSQFSTNKSYKVLFFGSDSIALRSLRKINEFRKTEKIIKQLDLVTSNQSKNRTEIEKYAASESLKIITWPLHQLNTLQYDIGLIVAFGHLIKDDVLNKFPLGMVNVHPSLLPRWRGAAPIIHTLMHGDEETGVTLMKIKPNVFDVGEIISQRRVQVPKDIKLPELTEQLSDLGADMLVDCIRELPHSLTNAQPQSRDGVTYAKKINKSISEVRWSDMEAVQVYNLYRSIYGLYPLTTTFKNRQMKLFDAFLHDMAEEIEKIVPGTLQYCTRTNAIKVLCKDKRYIYFKSLRIVGKREITALDFYNGYIKNTSLEKRCCLVC
ncbi:methionyl-tRNA formyltransferase, mitochondrial [Ostrinia furnacalis]|uniref:methionyl-tRNA formyltransferase, mitochondrial n=1 Tax=Ostrinia furnacalis TaxID=93504 RepID=UPI00103B9208|nr:methionyl-tRNA formyltransferase, mitochondrial [Ostrinia furnacalis]